MGYYSKKWFLFNSALLLTLLLLLELTPSAECSNKKKNKKDKDDAHKHGKGKDDSKEEEEKKDKKIKCFECESNVPENCTESDKECKYCFTFNATTLLVKGCLKKDDPNDVSDEGCVDEERNGLNGTTCYCKDDLCNEYTSSSYSVAAKVLLIVVFFFTSLLIK